MKKILIASVLAILLSLGAWFFFIAKSSSYALLKYVPESSRLVVGLDLLRLSSKLNVTDLKKLPVFQPEDEENLAVNQLFIGFLENPLESGIDFTEKPLLFWDEENDDAKHVKLIFEIANEDKFEAFLQQFNLLQHATQSGDIQHLNLNEYTTLAWNTQMGIIALSDRNMGEVLMASGFEKKEAPMSNSKYWRESHLRNKDLFCFIQINKDEEEQMRFLPIKASGDMGIGLGINFEDGLISIENKNAFEKSEDADLLKAISTNGKQHFLNQTIAESPFLALQLKFNMKAFSQFIMSNEDRRETIESIAKGLNTDPESILDMLSGEVALTYSGTVPRMQTRTFFGTTTTKEVDFPQAGLFFGIRDQEKLKKILDQSGQFPENGLYTFAIPFLGDLMLVVLEDGMVFFLDEPMAKTLAAKKKFEAPENHELVHHLESHPNSAYLDVQKALASQGFINSVFGTFSSQDSLQFYTSFKSFSQVNAWMNQKVVNIEIRMLDEKQNALTSLLYWLNDMYLLRTEEPNS